MEGPKSTKHLKANRKKWKQWIETWQNSDQSVLMFCREHQLSLPAFYYWKKKFINRPEVENKEVQNETGSSAEPKFIPVKVEYGSEPSKGVILYYPNGCYLRLEQDCDPKLLRLIHESMGVIAC